ncbi:MAG: IgGFc-binding protein, partial [Pseudomonadota bacterium]
GLAVAGEDPCNYNKNAKAQNIKVCAGAVTSGVAGICDYGDSCAEAPNTTCQAKDVCVLDAQHGPFAVAIFNPDLVAVDVTISNAAGHSKTITIESGKFETMLPQTLGFPDQSLDYSGIETKAYRLQSTRPVVAYQFNPLDNVGVFSNDASLLLPTHTFDTAYYYLGYPTVKRRPANQDWNEYATVVASAPGTTNITVAPTVGIRAGLSVKAIAAGTKASFSLSQFQTLTLQALPDASSETNNKKGLTGTLIWGDQPFGAFSGHEATCLLETPALMCSADHLEDQIFPATTWGYSYVVARSKQRASEPDLVRILAQKEATSVQINDAASSCKVLGPGEHCDIFIKHDVKISANQPILVGHFLVGLPIPEKPTGPVLGDPALSFSLPVEQYRTSYAFLVPDKYNENYVSLVMPDGATVQLDDVNVTDQFGPIGSGDYQGARIPVSPGQHTLTCPGTCGVEVHGYSPTVSYLYAGGLNLKQIVAGPQL